MTRPTQAQLDEFATRLRALEVELEDMKRRAATPDAAEVTVVTEPEPQQVEVIRAQPAEPLTEPERLHSVDELWPQPPSFVPPATPAAPASTESAAPQPRLPVAPRRPRVARPSLPRFDASDLLGPRALAVAGGVVTLLGIVFFFVLAINRGWIGPLGRVTLGGGAAAIVFAGGLELRRRYGTTHAALAAVGAGIAGGYATVLSAAALYDLVPDYGALLAAAAIAAIGLVTSLQWRSQIVAGLGLIGAMLVPVAVVAQGGLSPVGTAFVAVVFAATVIVCLRTGWKALLVAGTLASAPQVLALVFEPKYSGQSPPSILAIAAVFAVLYAATGVARQLRASSDSLDELAAPYILGGGVVGVLAALRLFATAEQRGFAMLAIACVYAAAGAAFFVRPGRRGLSAILTFAAFTLGAVALANVLSGQPLAYAWAAQAAGLAWLSRRVREVRFQVWSAVYLLLALVHVLAIDAPPKSHLFVPTSSPADGVPAVVVVAAAAFVFAFYAAPWGSDAVGRGIVVRLLERVTAIQTELRRTSAWAGLVLMVYAASLGTLAVFTSFAWGWVAVSALWSAVGSALLVGGIRRRSVHIELGALTWIAVATTLVARGAPLADTPRAYLLLVVGCALLADSCAYLLVVDDAAPRQLDISAGLAAAATGLGGLAAAGLLSGQALAGVWAAEAVVFAWLGRRLRAQHLYALALVPLALAVAQALAVDAPPRQLLQRVSHPAHGVAAVVGVAVASALVAALTQAWSKPRRYGRLDQVLTAVSRNYRLVRCALLWLAGALATYGVSLATVAAFARFDWANVALAAIWTAIGTALLAAGFRRDSAQLRQGGLVWLGLTGLLVVEQTARLAAPTPRGWAFLVVAVASLATSVAYAVAQPRSAREPAQPIAAVSALIALALLLYPIHSWLSGRWEGLALLGLAGLYGAVAAGLVRSRAPRDIATLFWAVAVVVAGAADVKLLSGTFAVLGWAGLGVGLAWLAGRAGEPRLQIAAGGLLALAVGRALFAQAPPSHLFVARADPANGSAAILIAAAATGIFIYLARHELVWLAQARTVPQWIAGGLAVYGLSLLILELALRLSNAGLQTGFERGHTAVSAFWGVLGLALLYAGLKRRWRSLRVAGLSLFVVSLAKIFLYDLPSLNSITRALSFLAVGAVLLLGGFFYQRLTASDRTGNGRERLERGA